jgi:hypothetical protein
MMIAEMLDDLGHRVVAEPAALKSPTFGTKRSL